MSTIYSSSALQNAQAGILCRCAACGHPRPRWAVNVTTITTLTRGKKDEALAYLCMEPRTCRERATAAGRYGLS